MKDFIAGEDIRFPVSFMVGGQPALPDEGTVTYSLRDHEGNPIAALTDVPVVTTPTTHYVELDIPGEHNTLTPGKRFERRIVFVKFKSNGISRGIRDTYRLIPFLNHSVTPAQVRSFLGVNDTELPDEDIDLTEAYFAVEDQLGSDTLSNHLVSGTTQELAANMMIRMRAVLNIIPSLKQRVAQEESSGQKSFLRPVIRDFDALRVEAEKRYLAASEELSSGQMLSLNLVVVTQDTDPITQGG